MTRIQFYILSDESPWAQQYVACRLAARGFGSGLKTYVNTKDRAACTRMNDLLWTFREQSFIPHEICSGMQDSESPVVIGCEDEPAGQYDYLINLTDEIPHFFSRFERAAEIISPDARARQLGRARYKFYRDRGYPLEKHDL